MKRFSMLVMLPLLFAAAGCESESKGFVLPIGDVERGKEALVTLGCNHCHSIQGELEQHVDAHPEIHVVLGGTTTRIRTYGELVTSIINPKHRISRYGAANLDEEGDSRMPTINSVLTVQELVDITTYLQGTYDVVRPQHYPMYYP